MIASSETSTAIEQPSNNNNNNNNNSMSSIPAKKLICGSAVKVKGSLVRRVALSSFLLTLVLNVILAVVAILGPDMKYEWKVLSTSAVVMVSSLVVVACTPAMTMVRHDTTDTKHHKERFYLYLSWIGMISILVTAILATIAIWTESVHSEGYMKTLVSFGILSIACAYVCLMSKCHQHANKWLVVAADFFFVLTLFLVWLGVMLESHKGWEAIASLAVVSTGFTVGVPVVNIFNAWGSSSPSSTTTTTLEALPGVVSLAEEEVPAISVSWREQAALNQDGTKVIEKVETFPDGRIQTTTFQVIQKQEVAEVVTMIENDGIQEDGLFEDVEVGNSNNV